MKLLDFLLASRVSFRTPLLELKRHPGSKIWHRVHSNHTLQAHFYPLSEGRDAVSTACFAALSETRYINVYVHKKPGWPSTYFRWWAKKTWLTCWVCENKYSCSFLQLRFLLPLLFETLCHTLLSNSTSEAGATQKRSFRKGRNSLVQSEQKHRIPLVERRPVRIGGVTLGDQKIFCKFPEFCTISGTCPIWGMNSLSQAG